MDGFYAAYFAGQNGNSLGMFVIANGKITGVDVGGLRYDGEYQLDHEHATLAGVIRYTVPSNSHLITESSPRTQDQTFEYHISIPFGFADGRVITLDTPNGPINARFQKLRDWQPE